MNVTTPSAIKIKGEQHTFLVPEVMGILNVTPDSFYAGSRSQTEEAIAERAKQIMLEGATMIDVGAFSTRPDAGMVSVEEEMNRLRFALPVILKTTPEAIISVDTFRPDVAKMCIEEYGVDIINDVGAPADMSHDEKNRQEMFALIAEKNTPYILMSRSATTDAMKEEWQRHLDVLHSLGATNIILDPGYGFGKTISQNYAVLKRQHELTDMGCPLLIGVSRKRMIWQTLRISADEALNGTTVVNTIALLRGANILRVHDVREAVEIIKLAYQID